MPSTPQPPADPPPRSRDALVLRTVGKILLGCALLLLIMSLTILKNDVPSASGGGGHAAADASTPAPADPVAGAAASESTGVTLSPYQQVTSAGGYLSVSAAVDPIQVYDHAPPGSTLQITFSQAGTNQVSSTFLAIGETTDPEGNTWYQIRVPARPNGSTGWVRASDVSTAPVTHAIYVDLSDHRLDLYELGNKLQSYPVAVGRMNTPTALGDFFVTLKFRPDRQVYGELVMMISAFSEQLPDWPGGGQAGIHGTNDDSAIGKDVSAGCIRMHNRDILRLSESAPLGTPVFVQE